MNLTKTFFALVILAIGLFIAWGVPAFVQLNADPREWLALSRLALITWLLWWIYQMTQFDWDKVR
jgi:hypothetical protein